MSDNELNDWIALNVMGWTIQDIKPSKWFPDGWKGAWIHPKGGATNRPNYTTSPADAMAVMEKCALKENVTVTFWEDHWNVWGADTEKESATTLPLAICLFAQKPFTKPTP